MKKALITGITGQDGSYLAEYLLHKGYEVHGLIRRSSSFNRGRIDHIHDPHEKNSSTLYLHYGDLSDSEQISNIIYNIKPNEIYNLAAQSHVRVSFDIPEYTSNITGVGITRILEVIRKSKIQTKLYQASSSEMFGAAKPPQNESTSFMPRSPYACSKVYGYWMVKNYRDGFGLFASNGILFNHESPRRGETFVTRKITQGICNILNKKDKILTLGNLDARRDWGFAPEYVEGMWKILQQDTANDFVLGTGRSYSVRDFLNIAFQYVGLDPDDYIRIDPKYFRPTEVEDLIADPKKAHESLKWKTRISLSELVKIMIDADMKKAGLTPIGEGYDIIHKKFKTRWWSID